MSSISSESIGEKSFVMVDVANHPNGTATIHAYVEGSDQLEHIIHTYPAEELSLWDDFAATGAWPQGQVYFKAGRLFAAEDKTQALLNWQKIHDWAEQRQPGSILGSSCTNTACPLSYYLTEKTHRIWSVGPSIRFGDQRLEKPIWLQNLIEQTDLATGNERTAVTRELFLTVLERVKPESES